MPYTPPHEVLSPKLHWQLIAVLFDGGPRRASVAIGRWDGQFAVAMRWNGDDENEIGNPQSRGIPTWFIVPDEFAVSVLRQMSPEKRLLATNFFTWREEGRQLMCCKLPSSKVYLKQRTAGGKWHLERLESDDHTPAITTRAMTTRETFLPEMRDHGYDTPKQAVDALIVRYPGLLSPSAGN